MRDTRVVQGGKGAGTGLAQKSGMMEKQPASRTNACALVSFESKGLSELESG